MCARDSGARISIGLPDSKNRARGILKDGRASGVANVECGHQNSAAQIGSASGAGVGAFYGDVQIPVRRHAALKLIGTKGTGRRGVASFELKNGVSAVGTDGNVVGRPAKDFGVKSFSGRLICSGEFHPAKATGGMLLYVWHGRKVLRSWGGSKGR